MKLSIKLALTAAWVVNNNLVAGAVSTLLRSRNVSSYNDVDWSLRQQEQKLYQNVSRHLVQLVGLGGSPPANAFPLQLCQGDCDNDSDCDNGLECYHRDKGDPVPGCTGSLGSNTDYCVNKDGADDGDSNNNNDNNDDNDDNKGSTSTSGSFRLKLYWQQGYTWQDERRERKWCMVYNYGGSPRTGRCWYGRDSRSCRSDQVYIDRCNNDANQVFHFKDLPGNDEVMISAGRDSNLCFQREAADQIYLRQCNSGNARQRWFAKRGGFNERRFEISQQGVSHKCVTQNHHPKPGEVVEMFSCNLARSANHQSSYWNRY